MVLQTCLLGIGGRSLPWFREELEDSFIISVYIPNDGRILVMRIPQEIVHNENHQSFHWHNWKDNVIKMRLFQILWGGRFMKMFMILSLLIFMVLQTCLFGFGEHTSPWLKEEMDDSFLISVYIPNDCSILVMRIPQEIIHNENHHSFHKHNWNENALKCGFSRY